MTQNTGRCSATCGMNDAVIRTRVLERQGVGTPDVLVQWSEHRQHHGCLHLPGHDGPHEFIGTCARG